MQIGNPLENYQVHHSRVKTKSKMENAFNINLTDKNTNFVFTFGNLGVGKSTLMAGLCTYIQYSENIRLRKDVAGGFKGMQLLMKEWIPRIIEKTFPPQSRKGEIVSINVGIQIVGEGVIKPITFLEMSGEDLSDLDIRYSEDGSNKLKDKFINYLKATSICIIVTSVETGSDDDLLIDQFFEWLEKYKVKGSVAFVVAKWDVLEDKSMSISQFIKENMPATTKWLMGNNIGPATFFKFSIGETNSDGEIINLDLSDSKEIVSWLGGILYNNKS